MSRKHLLPTALLLFILGMQLSTFLTGSQVWPWMAYGMYAQPLQGPPTAQVTRVYARFENGARVEITPDYMDMGWFGWKDHVRTKLLSRRPRVITEGVERIEAEARMQVDEIELHITEYRLVDRQQQRQTHIRWIDMDEGVSIRG